MPTRSISSSTTCSPPLNAELPVIRDSLKPHQASLTPKLWSTLDSAKPGDVSLLRAASALADYDGTSPRWEAVGGKVAEALVTVNPVDLGPWLDALRPVRVRLTTPLVTIFRDKKRPGTERALATSILKDYASDNAALVADLLMDADPKLMDADPKAYAAFFSIAQAQAAKTLPLFQEEIRKKAFSWDDPSLDPAWTKPDTALVGKIEMGEGMLTERFAFCQTMPLDEFLTTAECLRKSGYRPIRLRPFADGQVVRVAAVWTRDGRNWQMASGLPALAMRLRDVVMRSGKFIPVDVAGYVATKPNGEKEDRYAAIWVEKARPDDDARLYEGATSEDHKTVTDRLKAENLISLTLHAMRGSGGQTKYCGVWGRVPKIRYRLAVFLGSVRDCFRTKPGCPEREDTHRCGSDRLRRAPVDPRSCSNRSGSC